MWYRIWLTFFGRRRSANPCVNETRSPVKTDFHTIVTKTDLSVTFKPTKSTYVFVTQNAVIERVGPVSFMGVHHARRNTEDYNSDEVEAMARQVASEHALIHFCHFIDRPLRIAAAY
jgi:hypothetical protein